MNLVYSKYNKEFVFVRTPLFFQEYIIMALISVVVLLIVLVIHTSQNGQNERFRHAPCKILFSEVQFLHQNSDFVELGKFCPSPGKTNTFSRLDGYYILIMTGSNELTVQSSVSLDERSLNPSVEQVPNKRGKKRPHTQISENSGEQGEEMRGQRTSFDESVPPGRTLSAGNVPLERLPRSFYFNNEVVTNTNEVASTLQDDLNITHGRPKRSNRNIYYNPVNFMSEIIPNVRPLESNDIAIVCLLFYKQSGRKQKNLKHFPEGKIIAEVDIANIKSRLRDVVLVGKIVPTGVKDVINRIQEGLGDKIIDPVSRIQGESSFSVSKCDRLPEMFNFRLYQYTTPTPGKPNLCKEEASEPEKYPFGFGGQTIQSHGQKLVVNVLWALRNKPILGLETSSPIKTASGLLNLSEDTIKKFQNNYETNSIGEPSKKRVVVKPVRDNIDSVKQRIIYEVLVSHYKQNQIPKLNIVREKFVEQVRTQELQAPLSDLPKKLFHCGKNTFRKILYSLGYKYGKINKRDAVLFDPRIVTWRGKYLKAIRDNEALGSLKLPVIYTDETWFDIFSRQSSGWIPRCPATVQQRKDFTFSSHKASRGPRIIIMHAGGENGFVEGMMEVYAVSKKDASGDYHDNVNSESYMKWFEKLLSTLEQKGPHIIVIDNAPYHSVSTAPPLSSRKQVLVDWLLKKKRDGKNIPDLSSLRKFEVEDLVRKFKSEEPHYRVDDLARQRGHKVLRTPPYNCQLNPIELVWSDIKRMLRDQNVDQNLGANLLRAKHILQTYTAESWKSHVSHVKKLEQMYWDGDLQYELALDTNPEIEIPTQICGDDENPLDEDPDDSELD